MDNSFINSHQPQGRWRRYRKYALGILISMAVLTITTGLLGSTNDPKNGLTSLASASLAGRIFKLQIQSDETFFHKASDEEF